MRQIQYKLDNEDGIMKVVVKYWKEKKTVFILYSNLMNIKKLTMNIINIFFYRNIRIFHDINYTRKNVYNIKIILSWVKKIKNTFYARSSYPFPWQKFCSWAPCQLFYPILPFDNNTIFPRRFLFERSTSIYLYVLF